MTRTSEAFQKWHEGVGADTRLPVLGGIALIALTIGGGGFWAATAPLSGAVMATGILVATGQNRTVQHLEGGIIEDILVREGDRVVRNQVVLKLNRTAAEATLQRLEDHYVLLVATRARQLAERNGDASIAFPGEIQGRPVASAHRLIFAAQESEFAARREALAAEIAVLRRQIAARSEQIDGVTAQRKSAASQAALIVEELTAVRGLFSQGLAQKSRVLALERTAAQLLGTEGEMAAKLAQTRQEIAELESRILSVSSAWREKIAADLGRTEADLADVSERMKAARDIAERVEVRAPVEGVVVTLHVNTPGGVIRSGEPVMDILPNGGLEIEAKVNPADIDAVIPGRSAQLRFSGLRKRTTPTAGGRVHYVSADRLTDRLTQQSYYVARIRMTEDLPAEVQGLALTPGMPVEVFVETGARTFLEYLLAPISDSLARAFREG